MRIAIDLRSLMETGGKISGIENYLLHILDKIKNDTGEYLGFYNSYRTVELPGLKSSLPIKFTRVPNKIFNATLRLFNRPRFEKLYGDFDVLWLPDLRPFALSDKTKLAITVHDFSPIMHPQLYSIKRRIWHSLVGYKKAINRANLIFADSEYTKYDLVKLFGVNQEKVKVVHLGIDHDRFHTKLDQRLAHKVRVRYNLPENYILSVSTVEPRKNIESLVAAFESLADLDTELVIAGRLGWLYQGVLNRIERSPKKNKIKLIGYLPEEDKPYLISLAKFLCYPSYYEGFGFVPLEAMACGVPVITSARTSMPEVCQDAALLIEPNSITDLALAMTQLNTDEALRKHFIAKGLEEVKKFSWHKTVAEIDKELKKLALT